MAKIAKRLGMMRPYDALRDVTVTGRACVRVFRLVQFGPDFRVRQPGGHARNHLAFAFCELSQQFSCAPSALTRVVPGVLIEQHPRCRGERAERPSAVSRTAWMISRGGVPLHPHRLMPRRCAHRSTVVTASPRPDPGQPARCRVGHRDLALRRPDLGARRPLPAPGGWLLVNNSHADAGLAHRGEARRGAESLNP